MRSLAIETVGTTGTLALLQEDRVIAELALDRTLRSAQSLAPAIEHILERQGWKPHDVELVAAAIGPGSFTGLRIGVTTAKVFAYATGCQLIGVSTMTAIASRVPADVTHFSVVLDAHRNELFVADFSRQDGGQLAGEQSTRVVSAEQWIADLPPETVVSGPGLEKWGDRLSAYTTVIDPALWSPAASAVGRVGFRAYAAGRRTSPFEMVPRYFRRTAAEEKAQQAGR